MKFSLGVHEEFCPGDVVVMRYNLPLRRTVAAHNLIYVPDGIRKYRIDWQMAGELTLGTPWLIVAVVEHYFCIFDPVTCCLGWRVCTDSYVKLGN